ncbi:unnamed protein product [Lactuca virosa]|uniref:Leucine-rich repeat-containing N-terminal plant-type domain-containing protein n=1 Tax=Lactuca virosa TaxID=75947 RepID=A0AAU9NM19_9ASTR|nr:unnamed protein product [Lactuca virosa]
MSNSKVLLFFSLFFFLIFVASSSSFNATTHKCSPQQTLDLLLFKQNLSSINFSFDYPPYYSPCQDWLGSDYYYPIMMNWNKNTDCCKWSGITCNQDTGDVISIDLSCGMLQGTLHPNTSLFRLPHLQTLNLAYNDLTDSQLPRDFSNSLTHLNISRCRFTGEISSEISFPPNLVSLDLSGNNGLQMQPYVLKSMLRNYTHLRELLISELNILGWVLPTYLDLKSSLKSLDLSYTGLRGKLPDNILNLQYLEKLHLRGNSFVTGPIPKVNMSINVPLKWLHLSFTNLSGEIPDSIGHLKSLNHLGLSSCGLVGSLPKSLVNLRNLTTLNVEGNMLKGTLPSSLFTLPLLENLYLGNNMFTGGLPSELFKCRSLKRLSLDNNQLHGEINGGSTSPSFIQLINLTHLGLSSNNFTGLWELEVLLSSLPNLQLLMLSDSGLSVVSDNSSSYVNPEFSFLGLASCKLNLFPESLRAMKNLSFLDLSNNSIHGPIPHWAGEIGVQPDSRTIPSINLQPDKSNLSGYIQ